MLLLITAVGVGLDIRLWDGKVFTLWLLDQPQIHKSILSLELFTNYFRKNQPEKVSWGLLSEKDD